MENNGYPINNVVVIGMGALGLLFGQRIHETLGDEHFCFMMDEERAARHRQDRYRINGEEKRFPIASPADFNAGGCRAAFRPDLIIVATKQAGLEGARELASVFVGDLSVDTTQHDSEAAEKQPRPIVISLLNGISSEDYLAETLGRERIIDCVAIGMDAMREGTSLTYENMGRLQLGVTDEAQRSSLEELMAFLDKAGVPYEICDDIRRAMWVKFMMNVGANQTCMVYGATYKEALENSPAKDKLKAAMFEVIALAEKEGITLTEQDYESGVNIFRNFREGSYPSMQQDALAGRKSEVELFAGTVLRLAEKHGIETPVNAEFYRIIQERERYL